jgi:hypothetical protein
MVWSHYSGINYALTAILWEVGIHLYEHFYFYGCVYYLRVAALLYYRKTTVSVFIDEMGGFVLVTAPRYKLILKNK